MDWLIIIFIIVNLIVWIIGLILGGYLKKKGEDYATKQGIEDLTEKVESVKLEYLKKIEEYKNNLNIKYDLEKILIESRVRAYKNATELRVILSKRKSIRGYNQLLERELMKKIFDKIPELLFHLHSHYHLREVFVDEIKLMEKEYNNIINYIDELKEAGKNRYSINFGEIESCIDNIQKKLIEFNFKEN